MSDPTYITNIEAESASELLADFASAFNNAHAWTSFTGSTTTVGLHARADEGVRAMYLAWANGWTRGYLRGLKFADDQRKDGEVP